MSFTALVSVIDGICTIIERVRFIQDLAAGNAQSVLTTADLITVVRGENARFFTDIIYGEIELMHSQFYGNKLPTVLELPGRLGRDIMPSDISSETGALYHIFRQMIIDIRSLAIHMGRLKTIFQTRYADLHVDEITRGSFALIHGYGLLLHIHAVYAELRRIQIGATSAEDPNLLTDTRSVLQYLWDAAIPMNWFNTTIKQRRLAFIGPQSHVWPGIGPVLHYYIDAYRPISSTTADIDLSVPSPPPAHPESSNRGYIAQLREQRVASVERRVVTVQVDPSNSVWKSYNRLNNAMRARGFRQGATSLPGGVLPRGTLLSHAIPASEPGVATFTADVGGTQGGNDAGTSAGQVGDGLEPAGPEWKEPGVIPENADEFIALSRQFLAQGPTNSSGGENV